MERYLIQCLAKRVLRAVALIHNTSQHIYSIIRKSPIVTGKLKKKIVGSSE